MKKKESPIRIEDLMLGEELGLEQHEIVEKLTSIDGKLDNLSVSDVRPSDWEFYDMWLRSHGFSGGQNSEELNRNELLSSYKGVQETVEMLTFAVQHMNDEVLSLQVEDVQRWMRDHDDIAPNMDMSGLSDVLSDLYRWQERRNILGAITGVEDERSNVQSQINRSRRYIDTLTQSGGSDSYMEPHKYVQLWKQSVNFAEIFHDLDEQSTASLETFSGKFRNFLSANGLRLRPEDYSSLLSSFDKLENELNSRHPFRSLHEDVENLRVANERLTYAQEAYNKALESGTKEEQKNAEATLNAARTAKQKALAEATDALHNSVGKVKEYVGMAEDLMGLAGQFGIDPPEWLEGYLEGTGQMLDGLESIDLTKPMSIVTGGIKALSGAVKGVMSLGGLVNWNGSNAKEVQETIDRLTERNETLQTAIEDLTDEIKASKGTKSVAAYRDAYKYQQETNANYLQMAQAQAGYHGSHHSWNYYWDGFSQEQIAKLSSQIGRQWNGDLWNLSPEEMKMLRSNVDMWTQIQNTGKGGYGGRLTDKLDDYIDQAGKLEELTNQLYEGLTGISFDSMYDSFIDQLMDMDASAEDFADNVSEYFMRAMLSNKIGEMYADRLEEWWKKFGKAMEDNDLTEAERKALQDEYMQYVDDAMKLRDQLAAATGYGDDGSGTSQSAKAGGFMAMTQDQGTKLEGMFTSGLQHWSSMDEKMENVSEKMNAAENHLAKIEENTGKSAGHLENIAENIVKILRDGLKMR